MATIKISDKYQPITVRRFDGNHPDIEYILRMNSHSDQDSYLWIIETISEEKEKDIEYFAKFISNLTSILINHALARMQK